MTDPHVSQRVFGFLQDELTDPCIDFSASVLSNATLEHPALYDFVVERIDLPRKPGFRTSFALTSADLFGLLGFLDAIGDEDCLPVRSAFQLECRARARGLNRKVTPRYTLISIPTVEWAESDLMDEPSLIVIDDDRTVVAALRLIRTPDLRALVRQLRQLVQQTTIPQALDTLVTRSVAYNPWEGATNEAH